VSDTVFISPGSGIEGFRSGSWSFTCAIEMCEPSKTKANR